MVERVTNVEIRLPTPGQLIGAIERLFKDALGLLPKGIRRNTDAEKLASLRERLHLGDFSRWKTGLLKYDKRRKGRAGDVRYPALQVTSRLIALLKGEKYFDDNDKAQLRADRALAQDLLRHWKRPEAQEPVCDILVLLEAHKEKVAQEIARLNGEAGDADRRDLAEAARQVDLDRRRVLPGQGRAALNCFGVGDAQHDAGGNPVAAGPVGAVQGTNLDKTPPILRLCVTPLGMPSPRPVNLLMALGVSRLASIAVTLGLDAAGLAESLMVVESMLGRIEDQPYVTRTWYFGPPASWGTDGARGAVWELADRTSAEEIWRALATAFSRPQDGCGNVLVLALASGTQARAHALVEMSTKAMAAGGASAGASVPVYLWRTGAPDAGTAESLLDRIRSCIEAGVCADCSTDVQAVFRMRLHGGATLAPEWDSADGEQIRLHDLAVSSAADASQPSSLDEMRAADLIARVQRNQNLLYALQFLPVSQKLLRALTGAPVLTRAVAGLLTPAELQTRRPAWRRPMADGYRSAPALVPSLAG